jgi:hypothetical protein
MKWKERMDKVRQDDKEQTALGSAYFAAREAEAAEAKRARQERELEEQKAENLAAMAKWQASRTASPADPEPAEPNYGGSDTPAALEFMANYRRQQEFQTTAMAALDEAEAEWSAAKRLTRASVETAAVRASVERASEAEMMDEVMTLRAEAQALVDKASALRAEAHSAWMAEQAVRARIKAVEAEAKAAAWPAKRAAMEAKDDVRLLKAKEATAREACMAARAALKAFG